MRLLSLSLLEPVYEDVPEYVPERSRTDPRYRKAYRRLLHYKSELRALVSDEVLTVTQLTDQVHGAVYKDSENFKNYLLHEMRRMMEREISRRIFQES